MRWRKRAAWLFHFLFRRQRLEEELDEELRSYYHLLVDRFEERGMAPGAARRAARMEFDGMEQVKEKVRDGFVGAALGNILGDVRFAWRSLRKSPGFAAVAVVTLALGIGVNTAVFSVVYGVLLRPLPYDKPAELSLIWSNFRKTGAERAPTSGVILGELEHRNCSFQDVAGIWVGTGTFSGDENPEQVKVAQVTPNFFQTLGVRAALGRTFTVEEAAGGRPALILSDGLWRRRFGADPAIVGKGVRFQGASVTVIGVLPPGFQLHFPADSNVPADVQAFRPFGNNIYKDPRTLYYIRVVGRLRPGITLDQAGQDLDRVAHEIRDAYTEFSEEEVTFTLAGMHADAVRDIRPAILALFGGAAFVLLICCLNVTSLLLARANDREKEMALRAALGASRGRIVSQLLTEGAVLCALGGTIGLAVAWAAERGMMSIRPERLARSGEIGLNWPVLAFAAAVSLGAVLLFGLAPAFEAVKLNLRHGLLRRRAGSALIVAEVMIGFVLVISAGLMIRTFDNIQRVRPGFEAGNLLTFQLSLERFPIKEWEAKLASLPGVSGVGATSHLPLDDYPNWYSPYRPEGQSITDRAALLADYRCITPGYLQAMGVQLKEGRYFNWQDRAGGRQVAIVDDLLARATWPGQSAVGKKIEAEHLTERGFVPLWSDVVGVVEHVRNHSLARQLRGEIYVPFAQSPRSPLTYVLRTGVEPLSLVPAIRRELRARDANLALSKVRPMTSYIEQEMSPVSFTAVLAGVFAGLALLLAAIGIYGVLYYQVSRRRHEMGVRMALGASGRDVVRLVMREGLKLTAIGLAAGVAGAALASRYLRLLIYGVSVADPVTYASALVLLAAAAGLGCWRPAARAAGANPVDAIRAE